MFKPDYFTDITWLHRLSHKLERFHQSGGKAFGCRCPVCGDSKKDKRKTRLFFYTKKNNLNAFCHNCGYSSSFYNFVRRVFPNDFPEYKKDQLLGRFSNDSKPSLESVLPKPIVTYSTDTQNEQNVTQTFLDTCVPMLDLDEDHAAIKYMRNRSFSDIELSRLYWSDDFRETSQSISPTELSDDFPREGRIVIPFFSSFGDIEMIQGRSIDPKTKMRYISIKTHDEVDKIYGKYEVDRSQTVYCCEGPLDSLFVDNCIATCDSGLLRAKADVYIFDNEPRNKEIVELIEKSINLGKNVVIWPTSPDKKIDINDMIQMGLSRSDINEIIQQCTYSGLKAKLAFTNWRKV